MEIHVTRDVDAIQIPSGEAIRIPAGTRVIITQSLGGTYTVASEMGLARISAENGDALGMEAVAAGGPGGAGGAGAAGSEGSEAGEVPEVREEAVWEQLRNCYDPEIPVNIVDLGLVYDCRLTKGEAGAKVEVKMTLTAPGCGMGPSIAADARGRLLSIPGVVEATVDLVWDPPWNQGMISEAGRMKLGLI